MISEIRSNLVVMDSICSYRETLPTDAELRAMREPSAVTNLFGWNPFAHHTYSGSSGIHCFTLGPYNTIQTLHVTFYKTATGTNFNGILARRGVFRQEATQR